MRVSLTRPPGHWGITWSPRRTGSRVSEATATTRTPAKAAGAQTQLSEVDGSNNAQGDLLPRRAARPARGRRPPCGFPDRSPAQPHPQLLERARPSWTAAQEVQPHGLRERAATLRQAAQRREQPLHLGLEPKSGRRRALRRQEPYRTDGQASSTTGCSKIPRRHAEAQRSPRHARARKASRRTSVSSSSRHSRVK